MKTIALVLATLYLHQYLGTFSECLVGLVFGALVAAHWRDCLTGALEIGFGWLLTAFVFDQLSTGRVQEIGAPFGFQSVEAAYSLTFFLAFLTFLSWSLLGRQLKSLYLKFKN